MPVWAKPYAICPFAHMPRFIRVNSPLIPLCHSIHMGIYHMPHGPDRMIVRALLRELRQLPPYARSEIVPWPIPETVRSYDRVIT